MANSSVFPYYVCIQMAYNTGSLGFSLIDNLLTIAFVVGLHLLSKFGKIY